MKCFRPSSQHLSAPRQPASRARANSREMSGSAALGQILEKIASADKGARDAPFADQISPDPTTGIPVVRFDHASSPSSVPPS